MRNKGIDVLLVYSRGEFSLLTACEVLYVAGFKPLGDHTMVILPIDDDPVLIVSPSWDVPRVTEQTWIPRVNGSRDVAGDTSRILKRMRLIDRSIGIVGSHEMPIGFHRKLTNGMRNHVFSDDIIHQLSRTRSEAEIDYARKAADIAKSGFESLLEAIMEGAKESELAAVLDSALKAEGSEDNFNMLTSSKHNTAIYPPTNRALDKGDVVLAEITPSYKGQYVQTCRTIIVGEPSKEQTSMYSLLARSYKEGLAAAGPRACLGDIAKAIDGVLTSAGYGQYCKPPYMRTRGHALGLYSAEPDEIDSRSTMRIQNGMLFVIQPNQYFPETGYYMCGETVLITGDSAEQLIKEDPRLYSTHH